MTLETNAPLVAMAKGTSRLVDIPVRDENGNNFDMTGGRAVFWVGTSQCASEGTIVIQKDNPSISQDVDGLWTVTVSILPADTEALASRASYFCECRVWDQTDNEYVIAAGRFEIDPSITVTAPTP